MVGECVTTQFNPNMLTDLLFHEEELHEILTVTGAVCSKHRRKNTCCERAAGFPLPNHTLPHTLKHYSFAFKLLNTNESHSMLKCSIPFAPLGATELAKDLKYVSLSFVQTFKAFQYIF